MAAVRKDLDERQPADRVVAEDFDVNETPVPYGGEMVVMDDEPWDLPMFSKEDVAAIGKLLVDQAQDVGFLELLEAEIDAPTLAEVHVLHRESEPSMTEDGSASD